MTRHNYLSTACLHALEQGREDLHDYCKADTGQAGAKKPAQCKWCNAACMCSCHQPRPIVDGPLLYGPQEAP